jgi:hypothetical protein
MWWRVDRPTANQPSAAAGIAGPDSIRRGNLLVMKLTHECGALCRLIMAHVQAAFNLIGEYLRNRRGTLYGQRHE